MALQTLRSPGRRADRTVDILTYLYIALPVIIFILGWVRWYIAVPATLVILYSFFRCLRGSETSLPAVSGKDIKWIAISFGLIVLWVYLSGIGGFAYQNGDLLTRNETFRLMVENPWPVIAETESGPRMLSYYIGFWMPAALFGKIFGLAAGYVFQYFWAVLGVSLVFLKMAEKLGRWSAAAMVIFIFFSGLDLLGHAVKGNNVFAMSWQEPIDQWTNLQYSSHTTQLFWVFNQSIYGWLLTLMILNAKRTGSLVLWWSCGVLSCTFPFVGMFPYLAWMVLRSGLKEKSMGKAIGKMFRELFTFENVAGGGVIGIISAIYLMNNTSATTKGVMEFQYYPENYLVNALVFVFFEAVIYYFFLFRYHRKNVLMYISLACLILCPFARVGHGIDFCMRASIPSLLVLCLLIIECMADSWKTHKLRFFALLAALLIGSFTPIHEFVRSVERTASLYASGSPIIGYIDFNVMEGSNFSSSTENNLFIKYLAK